MRVTRRSPLVYDGFRFFGVALLRTVSEVFPSYELLGWYAVGDGAIGPADVHLHQLMCAFNEVPIFVHLKPTLAPG